MTFTGSGFAGFVSRTGFGRLVITMDGLSLSMDGGNVRRSPHWVKQGRFPYRFGSISGSASTASMSIASVTWAENEMG
jgi:hypothetical protein